MTGPNQAPRSLYSPVPAVIALVLVSSTALAVEGPPLRDGTFTRPSTPAIRIDSPSPGTTSQPPEEITVYFQRYELGLNGSSLELWIDGVEYTESLRFWIDRAWLDTPPGFWSPGSHVVETSVTGATGGTASHQVTFNLTSPPTYSWPFDYDTPNVVANLMEDYQRFSDVDPNGDPYWHHGLDIRAPADTPVHPVIGGYIAFKGCYLGCSSLQYNVTVLGDDGLLWQYSHLKQSTLIGKDVGDRVEVDEVLGDVVFWCCNTNGHRYHHIHLNAVELDGFDPDAWRALAESPVDTPPAVPKPLSADFKWHNPLIFLGQAGDLDSVLPEFTGEKDLTAPEIAFLVNESDQGFLPVNDEVTVSGNVDVAAHIRDLRDVVDEQNIPGQPYSLGAYEVAYSIVPIDTGCFKGWVPRTVLARFDTVPGEFDGDLQEEYLLEVFQRVLLFGGATYTTDFDYGSRNFWYNLTNSFYGQIDSALGYWNTDGATIQGPLFIDGTYRVTAYAVDFAGNELTTATEVIVDNGLPPGDYCPPFITDLAPPDIEVEPPFGGSISFSPPPIPLAFEEILEGSARTTIPAEGWPAWYFDDPTQGLRVAVGVLDGNEVDVEYVPYLGDVILEIPAEVQLIPLPGVGGPPPEPFDKTAPSVQAVSLRLSTRLARHPMTGVALLGSPHGYDQLTFDLVMAESIEVPGSTGPETWVLTTGTGAAAWSLAPVGSPGPPPPVTGMTVGRADPQGVTIAWDSSTCTAESYHLLHGRLDDVASYGLGGSVCGLPPGTPYTWRDVPTEDTYFLAVPDNAAGTEGSWGLDSAGAERNGSVPSLECGNTARSNVGTCP